MSYRDDTFAVMASPHAGRLSTRRLYLPPVPRRRASRRHYRQAASSPMKARASFSADGPPDAARRSVIVEHGCRPAPCCHFGLMIATKAARPLTSALYSLRHSRPERAARAIAYTFYRRLALRSLKRVKRRWRHCSTEMAILRRLFARWTSS